MTTPNSARWTLIAKSAIASQLLTTALLGLTVPLSLTAQMASGAAWAPYVFAAMLVLFALVGYDAAAPDTGEPWRSFVPYLYMLTGAVYLALALASSADLSAPVLVLHYLVNAALCGGVAVLSRVACVRECYSRSVCAGSVE